MTQVVLLTGAGGFVGRQVYKALLKADVQIRLVLRHGRELPGQKHNQLENVIRTSDLFSESVEWWAEACSGVDTIIHVAWYAEPGKYLNSSKNIDCLAGTLNLARGAVTSGVRRLVGIGTCFEYEMGDKWLTIDTPLRPLTPYAGTKAAAFMALSQWLPAKSIQFAWCRLFYLYGEGEDQSRLVSYLRAKLEKGETAELTSGKQVRDFLNVADAGRMIADVALSDRIGPLNICSGVPITVRQLAEQIADQYGRRDLLKFGARPDNLVDPPRVVGVNNF